MANRVTPSGVAFIDSREDFVSKAYRDSGGVITIGFGFTGLSEVFAAYWLKTRGHALRMGDTITLAEANTLVQTLLDNEYAPQVVRRFGNGLLTNQFDAAVSVVYNAGAAALEDNWAGFLAQGKVAAAANSLRADRVTSHGKKLNGLVNRRAAEASLMLTGNYGNGTPKPTTLDEPAVREYQQLLIDAGVWDGPIDGNRLSSDEAVRAFQKSHDLVVDGKVGPATLATLHNDISAHHSAVATTLGGVAIAGGTAIGAIVEHGDHLHALVEAIHYGALAVVAITLIAVAYRYRGVILRKKTL